MEIKSTGPSARKRARTLILHATNDIEAALLHQMMLKLRETPPELGAWLHDVLRVLGDGEASVNEVADALDEGVTAINNRMNTLWKMGLVNRRADNVGVGGRRFIYWPNVVEKFEATQENQT